MKDIIERIFTIYKGKNERHDLSLYCCLSWNKIPKKKGHAEHMHYKRSAADGSLLLGYDRQIQLIRQIHLHIS